jgi:hypothetical protein
MVILAIVLDLIAAAAYVVQAQSMSTAFFTLGVILQIVISLVLLIMAFRYQGRAAHVTGPAPTTPSLSASALLVCPLS